MGDEARKIRAASYRREGREEDARRIGRTKLVPPNCQVSGPIGLNLGGRTVVLRPAGLAHSDTDMVVEVPDAVIPGASAAQERMRALLAAIAGEQGLRFLGTSGVFAGCPDCYLPRDGHLSREGHRRLAAAVAGAFPARGSGAES